jgi:hypothetical protein
VPRAFYSLAAVVAVAVDGEVRRLALQWARGRVWEEAAAAAALQTCLRARKGGAPCVAAVEGVSSVRKVMASPLGINTVALLTMASSRYSVYLLYLYKSTNTDAEGE